MDSFKFMPASLGSLVENLRKRCRPKSCDRCGPSLCEDCFEKCPAEMVFPETSRYVNSKFGAGFLERLLHKQPFPYDWLSSFDKLDLPGLPPREDWYDGMKETHISLEEYDFATQLFEDLNFGTFREYLMLYQVRNEAQIGVAALDQNKE